MTLIKMPSWKIEFTAKAAKEFSKLDKQTQQEISHYLERVLEVGDPRHFGKALVGDFSGYWRYRVGKYRIICELQHQKLVIEVITLAKRDNVYH